jgi:hypothetical protein
MADASRRYDATAEHIATGTTDLPGAVVEGMVLAPAAHALTRRSGAWPTRRRSR